MIKYLLTICSILILFTSETEASIFVPQLSSILELDTTPEPSSEKLEEPDFYQIVSYMPHFAGCEEETDKIKRKECSDEKIINYINEYVKYPKEARKEGIEGQVVVRFFVEKDGELSFEDKAILRNPGGGCGEEALRVIKTMPKWIPGKHEGKAVRVRFTLPVKFQLEGELSIFQEASIKWDGHEIKGQYKTEDPSEYIKATCTLDKAVEILSRKAKGLPLMFQLKGDSKRGFTQYYMSVGKSGKKQMVSSLSKNKGLKQKVLKALKPGEIIYFYNWEYKKTFLEILVK